MNAWTDIFPCMRKSPVETPREAEVRAIDVNNDGNPRNPDFSYLADNVELDIESSKRSTLEWYYRQYKKVEEEVKEAAQLVAMPFWFIAAIDMREMSFVHTGHFANGDKIIGTGKKTYRIPRGLGPAETWAESVEQAINYEISISTTFSNYTGPDMKLFDALIAWEAYNGLGFRYKGSYSEYVFGFTNFHNEKGRFVADGKYDPNSRVVRPGTAAFVLYLKEKGEIKGEELWESSCEK